MLTVLSTSITSIISLALLLFSTNSKLLNFDFKSFIDNFDYHSNNVKNRKADVNVYLLKDFYERYNKLNDDLNQLRMKLNDNNKK